MGLKGSMRLFIGVFGTPISFHNLMVRLCLCDNALVHKDGYSHTHTKCDKYHQSTFIVLRHVCCHYDAPNYIFTSSNSQMLENFVMTLAQC